MKIEDKVYMNDWMLFNPYEKPNKNDFFYLRVCQEVNNLLQHYHTDYLDMYLEVEEIKQLSCFLTAYFVDIISETNMYNAFTTKHYELYSKYLPFYSIVDDDYLKLEHIATDNPVNITRKSIDFNPDFKKDDSILNISVIKWMDNWWFTGTYSLMKFDADIILDEKNSVNSRRLFNQDENLIKENIVSQKSAFLEFNKDRLIKFHTTGKKVQKFIKDFFDYYNKSLNITAEVKEQSIKRQKDMGFFGGGIDQNIVSDEFKYTDGLVYYNPDSGIELLFGYNCLFHTRYRVGLTDDELEFEFEDMLMGNDASTNLLTYLIKNFPTPWAKFEGEKPMENLLINNFDFMLRFLHPESYNAKPSVTLI